MAGNAHDSVPEREKGKTRAGLTSEHDTPFAASCVVGALFGLKPFHAAGTARRASRTWSAHGLLLVVSANFTNEVAKGFVDVDALLGRSFNEAAAKVLCEFATLVAADLTLVFEIALVGNDNDGKVVLVLYAQDLLVER